MARSLDDYAYGYAQKYAAQGIGATEGLRQARQAGLRIRTANWYKAYAQAQYNRSLVDRGTEVPLHRKPQSDEIGTIITPRARGYKQDVEIVSIDRGSGSVFTRIFSIRTDDLMTHGEAMEFALGDHQENADKYEQTIIGATYLGTYELVGE